MVSSHCWIVWIIQNIPKFYVFYRRYFVQFCDKMNKFVGSQPGRNVFLYVVHTPISSHPILFRLVSWSHLDFFIIFAQYKRCSVHYTNWLTFFTYNLPTEEPSSLRSTVILLTPTDDATEVGTEAEAELEPYILTDRINWNGGNE